METHEHLIPDDDLPGRGILDPDFVRERLRESEIHGVMIWDEEEQSYRPSARALMVQVAAAIVDKAAEVDPEADIDVITEAVVGCLPWAAGVTAVDASNLPPGFVVDENGHATLDPDAVNFEVSDTFPEDWAGGNQ